MEFLILPHYKAEQMVNKRPNELNVISVERTESVDPKLCRNHLHLKIDDIQDWHIEKFDKDLKDKGIVYPEMEDVKSALAFDKQCNRKIHIIHCHAGISRSPSIGYVILRGRGWIKRDAMREIFKIAAHAIPNERIVRFTDELFN